MLPRGTSFLVVPAVFATALLLAAPPTLADRVDVVLPLGGTGAGTVERSGDVSTMAFLVSAGAKRKLVLTVKPAAKSTLQPTIRLIDPNGNATDPVTLGGTVKVKGTTWTAKIPDVAVGGLWRIEVGGTAGTTGAFTATVKGKDAAAASGAQVVPAGGSFDVPIEVGANQALTVTARRGGGSRITPRLRILDTTGVAIENGAYLGVSNSKTGVLTLKAFRLPSFGRYTLRFSGVDNAGGTVSYGAKTAPAKVKGAVPKADPGGSMEADPSTVATLDGSASVPAGGGALTYRWTQVGGPQVALTDETTSSPTFVAPDNPTSLAFELTVAENGVLGLAVPVAVEVARRPLADAGRSQSVTVGATVTLDASASTTRSGRPLTYSWRQDPDDAQQVTLSDATSASPTFTSPATAGVLRFHLTADDGVARSLEDTVVVSVGNPARSVADAGRIQVVRRMSTVHLSGLASISPSGLLGDDFEWVQVAGPLVQLDGANTAYAAFTAPRQTAELAFELVAGGDLGTKDRVLVRVLDGENGSPPLVRGNGVVFTSGGTIQMSAAQSSDPNGDPLTFRWSQSDGPALLPASPTSPTTNLDVPAGNETRSYVVQASDRLSYSPPDIVHVRTPGYVGKPVASAGQDFVVNLATQGATLIQLDGSASLRTQGTGPITYTWKQVSGRDWFDVDAAVPGFDPTSATPAFTLPADVSSLAARRSLTFSLVVHDGVLASAPDLVTVSYLNVPENGIPTVTAGASTTNPLPGTSVTLNSTTFDRDGDPVTVKWTQHSGTPVALSSTTARNPTFTAPSSGVLTFRVTPNDGFDDGAYAQVVVVVDTPPTARPTATPTFGPPGTAVTIDGSQSSDPEGNPLTYQWTQTAGPAVTFSATAQSFGFTSGNGNYTFRLVVNDGRQNSAPATISFSGNQPPSVAPTASASTAPYGSTVNLLANATGGGTMSYTWRQIREGATASDPPVTLLNGNSSQASFTVPDTTNGALGTAPSATFGVIANNGTASSEGTVKVTFYASFNNNASGSVSGAPNTNDYVYKIISNSCMGSFCHSGTSTTCSLSTGYGMGTASSFRSNSIGAATCSGGKGSVRISANSSSGSYFYQRLNGQGGSTMPTTGSLSSKDKDLIKDWIDQGASDN